jgi:hypothetical protein
VATFPRQMGAPTAWAKAGENKIATMRADGIQMDGLGWRNIRLLASASLIQLDPPSQTSLGFRFGPAVKARH